jgi:hypothetical protein
MSSMLKNKRQQARNEKVLQDLIKSVAGNDKCADCGNRNPGKFSSAVGGEGGRVGFVCARADGESR